MSNDSGYPENCDPSRNQSGAELTTLLTNAGQSALIDYMNTAVVFLETVVGLFKGLDTYTFLSDAGIQPSEDSVSYTDLTDAIVKATGFTPKFDCEDGSIYQITYYFNLQGALGDANFQGIGNDGQYPENCDRSRNRNGAQLTRLLANAGQSALVSYMNEAVVFLETVVGLFKQLDTYTFLSNAGITPSEDSVSYNDLTNAIVKATGFTPKFDCKGGSIYQITYYFNLKGALGDGNFQGIDIPSFVSSGCPDTVAYLPKSS
ncbi:ribonuclease T2-like [Tulasnella sp. 331]|nr:ribonuclease T2-like [Tulasnella sp. 331]